MFWGQFEQEIQPPRKNKNTSKKSKSLKSGRRRRSLSPIPVEQRASSLKRRRTKKNLDFEQEGEGQGNEAIELPIVQNVLNLPYFNSDSEQPAADEGEPQEALAMEMSKGYIPFMEVPEALASRTGSEASRIQELENEIMEFTL